MCMFIADESIPTVHVFMCVWLRAGGLEGFAYAQSDEVKEIWKTRFHATCIEDSETSFEACMVNNLRMLAENSHTRKHHTPIEGNDTIGEVEEPRLKRARTEADIMPTTEEK